MPLIARASKTVRNKNIIIFIMCAVALAWFAYDGYHTYPANDDIIVQRLLDQGASPDVQPFLKEWLKNGGWSAASAEHRSQMDQLIKDEKGIAHVEGWKTQADIGLQRSIVALLGLFVAAAIWWFIACQRRRAIAEETAVSPSPGIIIPWDKITIVDNSRWKKMGIVDISWKDAAGADRHASFDDYKLDRDALLPILDQLAEKAVNAEFLPKEPAPSASSSNDPPNPPPA